jgi:hypothetical protein
MRAAPASFLAACGTSIRNGGFAAVNGDRTSDPDEDGFGRIEETQAALRASIEKAKSLASESERLIRQYREEAREREESKQAEPPNPA